MPAGAAPSAAIYGCAGPHLSPDEAAFFRETRPAGFILFARNVETPEQVRALVAALVETAGHDRPLILIDQEGGRVQRLGPPHWPAAPPAAAFGALAETDEERAAAAVTLNIQVLAAELAALGINTDCLPLVDLCVPGSHDVIGDRVYSTDPEILMRFAALTVETFLAAGVLPVIKHLPGHGRAQVDSHHDLPRVATPGDELSATDFAVFGPVSDAPLGMTAHVIYDAIDPNNPATLSPIVVEQVIRGEIGFDGLLMSDDLSMKALSGSFADRTAAALAAGCDLVLHCNGDMTEMSAVAGAARPLDDVGFRRFTAAVAQLPAEAESVAAAELAGWRQERDELLAGLWPANASAEAAA